MQVRRAQCQKSRASRLASSGASPFGEDTEQFRWRHESCEGDTARSGVDAEESQVSFDDPVILSDSILTSTSAPWTAAQLSDTQSSTVLRPSAIPHPSTT